ncbi:unnamed protein product [Prorocentrum cordatum]|uniref:Uncharacterized protein n=1 Tax=Prorocentrum cordatum TaxID=2364126 RepID=A0ABN9TNJ8_9DINO|nr:unnamed protein product [Polarella glacialis]
MLRVGAGGGVQKVTPKASIAEGMDKLFGADCREKLQGQRFDCRGAVKLLQAAEPDGPEWLRGLKGTAPGCELYRAIETVESRAEQQFFEKCSFEIAAKGNAIYQHLRGAGHAPAAQGVVSFGGGESVLLEFATLYLFPGSGFDAGRAALFSISSVAGPATLRCLRTWGAPSSRSRVRRSPTSRRWHHSGHLGAGSPAGDTTRPRGGAGGSRLAQEGKQPWE